MIHSRTVSRCRQHRVLASHSTLPRIYSISILFLIALSSLALTKPEQGVVVEDAVQTTRKQLKIVTNLPVGTVGVPYSGTVSLNGNESLYRFYVFSGVLPTGLSLNGRTGALSGTPTVAGTSSFELIATNSDGSNSFLQTQITISAASAGAVSITISPLSGTVSSAGTLQFQAAVQGTSNTSVIWFAGAGSISSDGLFTAPTVTGSTNVAITATSSADTTKQATATVSVTPPIAVLAITTGTLARATAGTSYGATLSGTGGTLPYKWRIGSGALPSGLQLNGATGSISGVPGGAGSFPFSAQLTDAGGQSSLQPLTLTVNASTSSPNATPSGTCGPPTYSCSRTDSSFVPVPSTTPSWGGLIGTNTVVNDPDFHNPIVRVTDASLGVTQGYCTGLGGSGDVPQIWNADSTILLICDGSGAYFPIGFDPVNFKTTGPLYGQIYASGPGVFSHTDPELFYSFRWTGVYAIDYTDRTTPPTPSLIYDFANCGISGWTSNDDSDPAGDDTTDTIFGTTFSTTGPQGTGVYVVAYNTNTKTCYQLNTSTGVVTQYPGGTVVGTIANPDRFTIHNVKMKGPTIVITRTNCLSATCSGGAYAWPIGSTDLYTLDQVQGGGHWATGCTKWLNQPGNLYNYNITRDYLEPSLWTAVWAVTSSQCGASPLMSCTQPFDSHPAWLGDCSDTGPVCMATAVASDVISYPYQNEIMCFTTDGSNRQIRFAHTYSSMALQGFNAQWSIGGPSQDGRFYAWTTKAGGQFGCTDNTFNCAVTSRRNDVLVVKLQ